MIGIITSRTTELLWRRPAGSGFCLNYDSPQAQGLVAWWPARLGTYADDVASFKYNLTNTGPTQDFDPVFGPVHKFVKASSQYHELSGTGVLTAAPLSITAWVWTADDSTAANQCILGLKNSASAATRDQFMLYLVGSSPALGVQAFTASGSGTSFASNSPYPLSTWFHGAAVFASATSRIGYLNGVPGTAETTSRVPSGINTTSMGRRTTTAFLYFNGLMADVRVYNIALSNKDVYDQGGNPNTAWDLYYPLGQIKYFDLNAVTAAATANPWHYYAMQRAL